MIQNKVWETGFFLSDFFQHYTVRPTQPLEGVADQPVL